MGYGPLTTQQKKERHRKYAHSHFLRTRCIFKKVKPTKNELLVARHEDKELQEKREAWLVECKKLKHKPPRYACFVQPLNGDVILIGPYKNKKAAMVKRMKTVQELMEQGNAREFDVRWLALYEQGFFDDDPNDK